MKIRLLLALPFLAAYLLMHVHPLNSAETKTKPGGLAKTPSGKLTAAELLADAQKALAFTVKSTRSAGKELSPQNPQAKPFLQALQKTGKALESAVKAFDAKDPAFFHAISQAQTGVAQMQAAWDLTKSTNADVIKGAKALGGAVSALHDDFGPTAQRKAKGGELTDSEKQDFAKLKSSQPDFRKKIRKLLSQYKKDPALQAGLRKINKRSLEIEKAPDTVSAYTGALNLLSTISGLLDGYVNYVPPANRKTWQSLKKSASGWKSYYYTPGATYNWSYMTTPVPVYDTYNISVSSEEISEQETFIEESSFAMTDEESNEVAEESDEIPAGEVNDNELESEQEEVDESEDSEDLGMEEEGGDESGGDEDGGDEDGGDEGGGDEGGGDESGGDEGGGDEGGGDEGGGDEGGGDEGGGDEGGGDEGGGDE